ncbi:MAG: hypothetical protein JO306_09630 [Gemmatimonadetes bacterium]|nr:hypothetical protein [Gemmatimonadota bacterium]
MHGNPGDDDELEAEYEFTAGDFARGERGKYAGRVAADLIVRLDPDVATLFPDSEAVNQALRALASVIEARRESVA